MMGARRYQSTSRLKLTTLDHLNIVTQMSAGQLKYENLIWNYSVGFTLVPGVVLPPCMSRTSPFRRLLIIK